MAKSRKSSPKGQVRASIALSGFTADDQRPDMTVFALDRRGKRIEVSHVDENGQFSISKQAIQKAHRIAVGPRLDEANQFDPKVTTKYRPQQFMELLESGIGIEVARKKWVAWFPFRYCVSGSVRHCYIFPLQRYDLVKNVQADFNIGQTDFGISRAQTDLSTIGASLQAGPARLTPLFPFCRPVCDGLVEVYRRRCCCHEWVVADPRLPDLILDLERIVPDLPEIKWPPRPQPDPGPLKKLPFFKDGAIDQKVLHARTDLENIRSLSGRALADYINARKYLLCFCNLPTKVGQGSIQPDGDFNICWWEWLTFHPINCHYEYAYKVKQNINGSTVTIYDGVAANQWFDYDEDANLTSYHPNAISCGEVDIPGEGAFALLQDIGLARSYRLKTPVATGWDRVATPVYNDGLADPAANPLAAQGRLLNRNWGGRLRLRYHFSEEMKDIGAHYYRVSVTASDANGNPVGEPTYISPAEWEYYEVIDSEIYPRKVSLGAKSAGEENNLYEIPYFSDRDWLSGQYHALLDTTDFDDGRFLLTVEVFNNAGQRLRPNGAPNPGSSTAANFTFRRWLQETDPMTNVPFAALTHMLWWDNRKAEAEIVDFRNNGSPNTAECQFLENQSTANFSVGYRAYHPAPMFLLDHRLWWRRGLGGPTGVLTSPHPHPNNVGVPPNAAHQSGSNTFGNMLDTHQRCTFSLQLHVNVKTFNGIGTLDSLDDWDQASFALGIRS